MSLLSSGALPPTDGFYEWLLSDAPAARNERQRRRAEHAARNEQERREVASWCERTLADPDMPSHLRTLAEVIARSLPRRVARDAAGEAVPDDIYVAVEREHYAVFRRAEGDDSYRYPDRYLGPSAARQPVPDEPVRGSTLLPGDRVQLEQDEPPVVVAAVEETSTTAWMLTTTGGRRILLEDSQWLYRLRDELCDLEPDRRSTRPDPTSRRDSGLEL